jgi:anti-anti-sigma factor
MSLAVAFPDFSADRDRPVGHPFSCTLRIGDLGPTWVQVAGDLNATSAPRLAEALRLTRASSRLVVLDLRGLRSTDLEGVHVIVVAADRARRVGPRLMVVRGRPSVDRMFARSGASNFVDVVDLDRPESLNLRAID